MKDSVLKTIQDTIYAVKSVTLQPDSLMVEALKKYNSDPWYHDIALVLIGALIPIGVDIAKGVHKTYKDRSSERRRTEHTKFVEAQQSKQRDLDLIAEVIPECAGLATSLLDSLEQSLIYSLMFYKTLGYGNKAFKIVPDQNILNSLRDKHEEYRQKFMDVKVLIEKQVHRFIPIVGERANFYVIVNGLNALNPDFYADMNRIESLSEKGSKWFEVQRENTIDTHVKTGLGLTVELTRYMRSFRTAYLNSSVSRGNEVKEEDINDEFEKE